MAGGCVAIIETGRWGVPFLAEKVIFEQRLDGPVYVLEEDHCPGKRQRSMIRPWGRAVPGEKQGGGPWG